MGVDTRFSFAPSPNPSRQWSGILEIAIPPRAATRGLLAKASEAEELTALGKTAEMAGHASFFKADRLPALRAGLTQKTVFVFTGDGFLVLQVPFFENLADGVRDGEHQSVF